MATAESLIRATHLFSNYAVDLQAAVEEQCWDMWLIKQYQTVMWNPEDEEALKNVEDLADIYEGRSDAIERYWFTLDHSEVLRRV